MSSSDTAHRIRLPGLDGQIRAHVLSDVTQRRRWNGEAPRSRTAFVAAPVTANALNTGTPTDSAAIDWDTSMRFRHHVWELGLGVADAMDTAQRGGGLSWGMARELIKRSGREARSVNGALVCGATTDHVPSDPAPTVETIAEAYIEQCDLIVGAGGVPALMPSMQLARLVPDAEVYVDIYDRVVRQTSGPLILHWLGPAFSAQLAGYWGSRDLDRAEEVVLEILQRHHNRFQAIKISLLDMDREIRLRQRLPAGVAMLTGDDFNYVELIRGDHRGSSGALLGVFAAIAPLARLALQHLDDGDEDAFEATLSPTVELARHLFQAPTGDYKTGIVFLAYLNGHQDHFVMLAGAQSRRSVLHLSEVLRLADQAGALRNPDLAAKRMRLFLSLAGVEQ